MVIAPRRSTFAASATAPLPTVESQRPEDLRPRQVAGITGWVPTGAAVLRHPADVGPLIQLCPEPEPRRGKNRIHLDVRREEGDVSEHLLDLGARSLSAPGDPSSLVFADPSGDESCVLG